jgi:DNA-binding NtrC family response regulator
MSTGKLRVLVVESDPAMGNLLCKVLSKDGFTVALASSSHEGVAKFQSCEFDVVIIDEDTHKLDRLDVTRAIKERQPETSIIVITPFSSVDANQVIVKDNLRGERLYRCIDSPLRMEHLKSLLEEIVKKRV